METKQMKLTKQTLKRIIKEELTKVMKEGDYGPADPRNWGMDIEDMSLDDLEGLEAVMDEDDPELELVKSRISKLKTENDPLQTPGMNDRY